MDIKWIDLKYLRVRQAHMGIFSMFIKMVGLDIIIHKPMCLFAISKGKDYIYPEGLIMELVGELIEED